MARFIGGPCNGQTAPGNTALTVVCGGVTYTLLDDLNYHAGVQVVGGGVTDAETKQVGRAWHKLTHVFAAEVPAAVRRSKAGSARLKKLTR